MLNNDGKHNALLRGYKLLAFVSNESEQSGVAEYSYESSLTELDKDNH